jgi:hypothetical protein
VDDEWNPSTKFAAISPDFAERFGGGDLRWVNVLSLSWSNVENVASVLPFNTFDPDWPVRAGASSQVLIGTEGWSVGQRFSDWTEHLRLLSRDDAIIGWMGRMGIEARLSEPGHIARQVLEHLGSRALFLLQDEETLTLLNEMAGGVRRKGRDQDLEEVFERRS